ncbi:hypothetical protein MTYM_02196 [Methylococcales bacterium]|nr:hypothetical protein MTYM_02196 [Methylococcales bacterium]
MKVCVIGNSQVSALRMAVASEVFSPFHEIDFYSILVSRNHSNIEYAQPYTQIKSGFLHPLDAKHKIFTNVDSAVKSGLNLLVYDAIIISAAGYWVFRNQNDHWIFEIRLPEWEIDENNSVNVPCVVSSGLFDATTNMMQAQSVTMQICEQLANNFSGEIILQPWPLPSESILHDKDWRINILYGKNASKIISYYYHSQYRAIMDLTMKMRKDIVTLPYPNHEWMNNGFTPSEYETNDPWHMNHKYGSIVLKQAISVLT